MAIEARGEATWRVTVTRNKRTYREVVAGPRMDAEEVERAIIQSCKRFGEWPPPDGTLPLLVPKSALRKPRGKDRATLRDAFERACADRWAGSSKSAVTQRRRAGLVMRFFEELGRGALEDIGAEETDKLKAWLVSKQGYAPNTVNTTMATLSVLFTEAMRHPALTRYRPHWRGVKATAKRDASLSAGALDEAQRFFVGKGWFDMAHCTTLAVELGLRRNELLGLEVKHFQRLDDPTLAAVLAPGSKSDGSYATLPLSAKARQAGIEAVDGRTTGRVFPGLSEGIIARRWNAFRDHAGLAGGNAYSFHVTRHTTAKRLLDQRLDITRIRDFMRHSSTKTTEKYLAHDQSRLFDARDAMDKASNG